MVTDILIHLDNLGLASLTGRVYDNPFSALESRTAKTAIFGINGALSSDYEFVNGPSLKLDAETGFNNVLRGRAGGWANRAIPNRIGEVADWRNEDISGLIVTNCFLLSTKTESEIRGMPEILSRSMSFHERITFPMSRLEVIVTHGSAAREVFLKRYPGAVVAHGDGAERVEGWAADILGRRVTVIACRHFSRARFCAGNAQKVVRSLARTADQVGR